MTYITAFLLRLKVLSFQESQLYLFFEHRSFVIAAPIKKAEASEIPEAYVCIITQELMNNPVICFLDGRTYENSAIREWLGKHKNSPFNRKPLTEGTSIDQVLIPNYNLKEAIDAFKEANNNLVVLKK